MAPVPLQSRACVSLRMRFVETTAGTNANRTRSPCRRLPHTPPPKLVDAVFANGKHNIASDVIVVVFFFFPFRFVRTAAESVESASTIIPAAVFVRRPNERSSVVECTRNDDTETRDGVARARRSITNRVQLTELLLFNSSSAGAHRVEVSHREIDLKIVVYEPFTADTDTTQTTRALI